MDKNKLDRFTLTSLSSFAYCLRVRPEAYPREEPMEVAPLGRVLAMLPNIRLGRKGLPGKNTLAYLVLTSAIKNKVFRQRKKKGL
jgi:hypothetical protein